MIRDLKPEPRGHVPLACKQAYYKKLKLEPLGVECPQSWNSKATAVSVVGALYCFDWWLRLALTLDAITPALVDLHALLATVLFKTSAHLPKIQFIHCVCFKISKALY